METLQSLQQLALQYRENRDRKGYFAAYLSRYALRLRDAVAAAEFKESARTERVCVSALQRYLESTTIFQQGGRPISSWDYALAASRDTWLVVAQHILLGLNAHLNLDVGSAVASACPPDELPGFRGDFEKLCGIHEAVMEEVWSELGQLWPAFAAASPVLRSPGPTLIRFRLPRAFEQAWRLAQELSGLNAAARGPVRDRYNQTTRLLAEVIRNPGVLNVPLMSVRLIERGDIAETIELIQQP